MAPIHVGREAGYRGPNIPGNEQRGAKSLIAAHDPTLWLPYVRNTAEYAGGRIPARSRCRHSVPGRPGQSGETHETDAHRGRFNLSCLRPGRLHSTWPVRPTGVIVEALRTFFDTDGVG